MQTQHTYAFQSDKDKQRGVIYSLQESVLEQRQFAKQIVLPCLWCSS